MAKPQSKHLTHLLAGLVWLMFVTAWLVWWARPLARDRVEAVVTGTRIDLNGASVHELALLPGIGPRLAQRVVEDRQRAGPFVSVEGLGRVARIGPSVIARVRPLATCGPGSDTQHRQASP